MSAVNKIILPLLVLTINSAKPDGPSNIEMTLFNNNTEFNICKAGDSFNASCFVPLKDGNTAPTFHVSASDNSTITFLSSNTSKIYHSNTFKVTPEQQGVLTITCVASNSIFPENWLEKRKAITVHGPETAYPILIVNGSQPVSNGDVLTVTSGDTVQVTCRITGGAPAYSVIAIQYRDYNHGLKGKELTQNITVEKRDNEGKILCISIFQSFCDPKTSEFTFRVQYSATVDAFTVNSNSEELVISNKDTVRFVCEADGNPMPRVTVRGQRSMEYITLDHRSNGLYGVASIATKKMFFRDTDTFTCMADNGVGGGVNRSVSIKVLSAPELSSVLDQSNNEFFLSNNTDLTISIPIVCSSQPTNYTLRKVTDPIKAKNRSVTEKEVTSDRYNVAYKPGQPTEGTVLLWIFKLFDGDSGQYVLTIENRIGQLDYEFNVSIVADDTMAVDGKTEDRFDLGKAAALYVGVASGLLLCVYFFIAGIQVGRWLLSRKEKMCHESPAMNQAQEANSQSQYESIGQAQTNQTSRHNRTLLDNYDQPNTEGMQNLRRHINISNGYLDVLPEPRSNRRGEEATTLLDNYDQQNTEEIENPRRHNNVSNGYLDVVPEPRINRSGEETTTLLHNYDQPNTERMRHSRRHHNVSDIYLSVVPQKRRYQTGDQSTTAHPGYGLTEGISTLVREDSTRYVLPDPMQVLDEDGSSVESSEDGYLHPI